MTARMWRCHLLRVTWRDGDLEQVAFVGPVHYDRADVQRSMADLGVPCIAEAWHAPLPQPQPPRDAA